LPRQQIERICNITPTKSEEMLYLLSKVIFPVKPTTVAQMIRDAPPHKKISLGCSIINNILKGGLPTQGIIEITGEAGCGKTQVALQALMYTILPEQYGGLGGAGFYLSTEVG